MSRDPKQQLINYLAAHHKTVLATVNDHGNPVAHTVEYVNRGATIYFMTFKDTRKVKHIANNPAVAYTVDEDYADWSKIQGVQMEGRASMITAPEEAQTVQGLFIEKFPFLAQMPQKEGMLLFKVEPEKAMYIDNLIEWGYRDYLQF